MALMFIAITAALAASWLLLRGVYIGRVLGGGSGAGLAEAAPFARDSPGDACGSHGTRLLFVRAHPAARPRGATRGSSGFAHVQPPPRKSNRDAQHLGEKKTPHLTGLLII